MLETEVQELITQGEAKALIKNKPFVMICCGRIGPMCIPVYESMRALEPLYPFVAFRTMDFDAQVARWIKGLPECATFKRLPFIIYFREGEVVRSTSAIQTKEEIDAILDKEFSIRKKAKEIDIGYHPLGYRIDKTAPPMDRYTKWEIGSDGHWLNAIPVCFHALPEYGWIDGYKP